MAWPRGDQHAFDLVAALTKPGETDLREPTEEDFREAMHVPDLWATPSACP